MAEVLNGSYPDLNSSAVTLVNGEWRTEHQLTDSAGSTLTVRESVVAGPTALGDLNGDGAGDAAVVLAFNGGGSGTFMHLVSVLLEEDRAVAGKLVPLGDRVAVRSLTIEAGTVTVDALVHRRGDGLCCPSLPIALEFELRDGLFQWRNREACNDLCADPIGANR